MNSEEYLKVDEYYVMSPGLLRQITDALIKIDPVLAQQIIDANK